MTEPREPSRLSRWSRRKHESRVEEREVGLSDSEMPGVSIVEEMDQSGIPAIADQPAADQVDAEPVPGGEVAAATEEPLLTDDDMPPLSALDSQSDISMFFNRGVSKALRQAALKYVFQLPQYNIRDGLNDYDEDYTYFEPLGDTVTCDMKFHQERKEREAREAEEQAAREAEEAEQAAKEQEQLAEQSEQESSEPDTADQQEGRPAEAEEAREPLDADIPLDEADTVEPLHAHTPAEQAPLSTDKV